MSNENLSLHEVADVVEGINTELGEPWWDKGYNLSAHTNGFQMCVCLGDLYLWDDTDDQRDYVYDDKNDDHLITEEGYEMRESLRSYLVKELKFIGSRLMSLED